jgi:2-oxoglutarate ferredoxin oxidoreductase subunit alpha
MTKRKQRESNDDLSIVLCGTAGSGVQTVEQLLAKVVKRAGFHVFATKEYMSRVRGGLNSTTLRVGNQPVRANIDRIDILIPLNQGAVAHVKSRISEETLILCEPQFAGQASGTSHVSEVDFTQIAQDIGNKLYSNIVAVGLLAGLLNIPAASVTDSIRERFGKKDAAIIEGNLQAAEKGHEIGRQLASDQKIDLTVQPDPAVTGQMLISGVDAVGIGAIAGGCNFIGAYPMSPSTGLLTFLAKQAEEFGIVVEQAEDEIAGVNMALGAWYAGARAIASSSGGGFALMTEGVSLCGMIETPLVIHIAQRPGPATGLPTRTGQEDLNLALYAGHGEFPRAIFAPGNLQQAFDLTAHAFELADRYQVPVFILTDQYFMDTYYNTDRFDLSKHKVTPHIVQASKDYRRYELTNTGISPRAIPGHGDGLVVVDSDEHDTEGHITEDLDIREQMVDKRLAKGDLLLEAVIQPTLWPNDSYKTLLLCWGSTLPIVQEALTVLSRDDVSLLHFGQLWPLPKDLQSMLKKAERVICLEGNATGQFAQLVEQDTGVLMDEVILKYNGLTFTVEDVVWALQDKLS